tara:strand:- start:27 stop:671 length:645 start_codon:yes stop_codon:yes gene_type:complete
MILDNFTKIALSEPKLSAYMTKFNIFKNREVIFPHEETIKANHITDTIIKNSVIVFGANIKTFDEQLMINDEIFILDGHHRFQYIIENSIEDLFEVVFIHINDIKIESHNSELLISDDIFLQKISQEKGFSALNNSKYFISLNKINYYSKDILDINELYSFKKELLEDLIILPIRNDDNTKKSLVNFTPLTAQNFDKNTVFPYKSTWITPRFDV